MDIDPRLHFVTATAIIEKDGKFLIVKRAPNEKAFPNKWTVPGGKLVYSDYKDMPHKTDFPQWYGMMEWLVRKEVREETGVEIERPAYVTDLVFVRPDGYPVVVFSFWAKYKSGEVVLNHEMTDFTWVTAEEAKAYDMISGIDEEIAKVAKLLRGQAAVF
jgi:8-oxo-dGTP pyrophosphatase MutT (NUDIX family)